VETSSTQLPADLATCHQLIRDLLEKQSQDQFLIDKLQHQLEQMLRHRFGQRAERIDLNQLELFARELLRLPPDQPLEQVGESTGRRQKKEKKHTPHGRRPLPAHLPRERVEHDVPSAERGCQKCGLERQRISEETSEQLEYQPASLKVLVHVRFKYACLNPECEGSVITADKPWQPIEKGLPGPGLLSHVVVSKYADHLPLNRQEGILARQGVELSRSTLCGWAMSAAELVKPLYELMWAEVRQSKVVPTDDTTVPVQDRERTKTKTGRLWTCLGDRGHPYTVFAYTPDRSREGPAEFLRGFSGYLQADAYAGYNVLYDTGRVIWVGCNAHARRKFVEAQTSDPARALTALAVYRQLYEVERQAKERGLDARGRFELRQQKAKPLWDAFHEWLKKNALEVLPKSPLGEAIGYLLGNWEGLTRYLEDGDLEIDNNAAERALRLIVVGRKNWLFAGSDRGGRAAAILYSFTATCKRLGIDPFAYLRDIFACIAGHPANRLAELLPDRWLAARKADSASAIVADALAVR